MTSVEMLNKLRLTEKQVNLILGQAYEYGTCKTFNDRVIDYLTDMKIIIRASKIYGKRFDNYGGCTDEKIAKFLTPKIERLN